MIPTGIEDKYQIIKILQESAATAVLLVRHRQIGDVRVLKAILKSHPDAHNILSEANLLSGIKSPGVPTIYDTGQTLDCFYLVEEFIDGQSLQDLLFERAAIDKEALLDIFIKLCDILAILHDARPEPLIYRDLKPEHVIIVQDQVRLIDFGITVPQSQSTIGSFGSKSYASPEQLKGLPLDARSDVYSLGLLFDEAFSKLIPDEDYKLSTIIASATAENPQERTKSVVLLQKQLLALTQKTTHVRQKKKYLNKNIAVISAPGAVGCTHIAIALCQYLNKKGHKAYYRDMTGSAIGEILSENLKSCKIKEGVLYHDHFMAVMDYGPAVEHFTPPDGIFILDCGNSQEPGLADMVIYVTTQCTWNVGYVNPSWIMDKSVVVVSNLSSKLSTLFLAGAMKKKIYRYPFSSTDFSISREEEKLFNIIFKNYKEMI